MFDAETGSTPPLRLRDVVVTAPDGRTILTAAALDLAPGVALGVRGPSGAGKTTLLHVLAGLIRPDSGVVRWGEDDLVGMGEGARDAFRRRRVGMIFQDFMLFDELSALENAALPAAYAPAAERAALRARAAAALRGLGLGAGAGGVATLSGGERQRVAAARALAADPPILLADEPTASLDRAAAGALMADLVGLARERGRTLIVVSHDERALAALDHVIEVRDGAMRA